MDVLDAQHAIGLVGVCVPVAIVVCRFIMILFQLFLEDLERAGYAPEFLLTSFLLSVYTQHYDHRYARLELDD